jgi:hypothetical protein
MILTTDPELPLQTVCCILKSGLDLAALKL